MRIVIKERRRRQRIDKPLLVSLSYQNQLICARTKNLSILGAYLELKRKIPVGTQIAITIKLPAKKHKIISCSGIAFRCQILKLQNQTRYGTGIFFRSFAPGDAKRLSTFINRVLLQEKKKKKIRIHKRRQKKKGGRKR